MARPATEAGRATVWRRRRVATDSRTPAGPGGGQLPLAKATRAQRQSRRKDRQAKWFRVRPNVRANRTPAAGWLGPGWRKCTAYRQTGPRQPAVGGPVVQRGVRRQRDHGRAFAFEPCCTAVPLSRGSVTAQACLQRSCVLRPEDDASSGTRAIKTSTDRLRDRP